MLKYFFAITLIVFIIPLSCKNKKEIAGERLILCDSKHNRTNPQYKMREVIDCSKSGRLPQRTRPLASMNIRFEPIIVEDVIMDLEKKNKKLKVLEFGAGDGRVLLELKKKYPDFEFHGTNKNHTIHMDSVDSLRETALFFKVFTEDELEGLELPNMHFFDAGDGRLSVFKDNYFDLIITQNAASFIAKKNILLEEFWRILKKGGVALIHIRHFYFLDLDVSLESFLEGIRNETFWNVRGFDIELISSKFIYIRKNKDEPLCLGLELSKKRVDQYDAPYVSMFHIRNSNAGICPGKILDPLIA